MSVRLSRLQAEYERLMLLFEHHPHIRIVETAGRPPDRYTVEYHLKGLIQEPAGIQTREVHRARILLDQDYPKTMPQCIMLTPVFHPNIDHLAICTEDIGAAGQTLDQLIVFIGEMICYQAYNLQSPRNGEAAKWAREHAADFPLESADLTPAAFMKNEPLAAMASRRAAEIESCQNCGASGTGVELNRCSGGHVACPDCGLLCANCRNPVCVLCQVLPCRACRRAVCSDCRLECTGCGHSFCLEHIRLCPVCRQYQCAQCAANCAAQGERPEPSAPPPPEKPTSALNLEQPAPAVVAQSSPVLDEEPAPATVFEELQPQLAAAGLPFFANELEPPLALAAELPIQTSEVETPLVEPNEFGIASPPVPHPFTGFFANGWETTEAGYTISETAPTSEPTHKTSEVETSPAESVGLAMELPRPIGEPTPAVVEPPPAVVAEQQPVCAEEPPPPAIEPPAPVVVLAEPPVQAVPFNPGRATICLTADEVAQVPESSIPRPTRSLRVGPEPKRRTSGKAITALVFGILGLPVLGILLGWFALLFALLAMRDLRADSSLSGRGLANAGLALGILDLALWLVLLTFYWAPGIRHVTPPGHYSGPQLRPALILEP